MSSVSLAALRELIISRPKPPVQARVIERDGSQVTRSAFVLFDGVEGWYIDDGSVRELNLGSSALTLRDGRLTAYVGHVHANAWVKPLFAGHLMTAFEAPPSPEPSRLTGSVVDTDSVLGFECHVAEIGGMKHEDPARFRMWVQTTHGFVLRMERLESALVLEVEQLTIGEREKV